MEHEQIVFVGTSDLSGHFRGKSFPASELAVRQQRGVGLAPTNLFLSAFGAIHTTPFGTQGEVFMVPDPSSRVFVPCQDGTAEHFYIADLRTLAGETWGLCPRQVLRRALDGLQQHTGLTLLATFEQEFTYSGVSADPWQPYALDAYRRQGAFGESLLATLRQAGVAPDSFLAEYGPRQFEVTTAPASGMRAADEAVITREITQAVAWRRGHRASFTPLPTPDGVSNGTHIHWSFLDKDQRPTLYDGTHPWQLSALGRHFVAGVQHHLPVLCALTAPSVVSYYRLRPNRWAPVRADVAVLDRGAALRICVGTGADDARRARQCNVEFRVADATANPYLALAALVQAGVDGVRRKLEISQQNAPLLPGSLEDALELLEGSDLARHWLGSDLHAAYLQFKRAEITSLQGLDEAGICHRYAEFY